MKHVTNYSIEYQYLSFVNPWLHFLFPDKKLALAFYNFDVAQEIYAEKLQIFNLWRYEAAFSQSFRI